MFFVGGFSRDLLTVQMKLIIFFTFTEELVKEKEKYKNISEELEQTVNELQGY